MTIHKFPAFLLGISCAISSPPKSDSGNPLAIGEVMYGGSALFSEDVKSQQSAQVGVAKSISTLLQNIGDIGKVASFHPEDEISPLQDLHMTGGNIGAVHDDIACNSVNSTRESPQILRGISVDKSFEKTKQLRRKISRVGSFTPE